MNETITVVYVVAANAGAGAAIAALAAAAAVVFGGGVHQNMPAVINKNTDWQIVYLRLHDQRTGAGLGCPPHWAIK